MTIGKIVFKDECVIEWSIKNFFSLSDRINKSYNSPSFLFNDEFWHLEIYPNVQYLYSSRGWIDLYLHKDCWGIPITEMEYSLGVKAVEEELDYEYSLGVKNVEEGLEYESHFKYTLDNGGFFYGLPSLLSRAMLSERKSELLSFGTLTLVCRMQHSEFIKCSSCNTKANCSHCKEVVDSENAQTHEKKCMEKPIKCPECSDVVALKNWNEHECKTKKTEGACSSSSSSSNVVLPKSKILKDFKELFMKKEHCDVVFRVKDQKFHAHKAILSARSSVFSSTFRHDMREKATGVVDIKDFDPSIFLDFLYFLYCEELENLSEKNVFSLFTASDKYDVIDLREKCMEFIKENLSVVTFCETITLALKHTETELLSLSTNFFIQNADKIIETVQWQSFLVENPTESNELFIKLLAFNKNSKK